MENFVEQISLKFRGVYLIKMNLVQTIVKIRISADNIGGPIYRSVFNLYRDFQLNPDLKFVLLTIDTLFVTIRNCSGWFDLRTCCFICYVISCANHLCEM